MGSWTHVASVWGGTTITLFINGVEAGSTPFNGPVNRSGPSDQSLKLGIGWTLIDGFNEDIDEMRISRVARYASSFSPVTRRCLDNDTLGLWHLDPGEVIGGIA